MTGLLIHIIIILGAAIGYGYIPKIKDKYTSYDNTALFVVTVLVWIVMIWVYTQPNGAAGLGFFLGAMLAPFIDASIFSMIFGRSFKIIFKAQNSYAITGACFGAIIANLLLMAT